MIVKRPAVPKIGVRGIPQRAELSGDVYANLLWYLEHWVGHIAQMRDQFQKQRCATVSPCFIPAALQTYSMEKPRQKNRYSV